MLNLDTNTEFGARVERRLREDLIIWLTTVSRDGTPQPVPVWFYWDGDTLLIYSQPDKPKLRHITRNPKVSLNFDGDARGGNIIVLTGEARIDPAAPPANKIPAYIAKYEERLKSNHFTPEYFAAGYSVAIRVTLTHLRGH